MAFLPFIGPAIDLVNGVMKRVLPDKMSELDRANLQQALTLELLKADWGNVAAQLDIDKAEAQNPHLFVAGWRPAVGWTCAAAFGYSFVLQPFFVFAITMFKWQEPPLPALDIGPLLTVLGGLLGLGGLRTLEKVKGVSGVGH